MPAVQKKITLNCAPVTAFDVFINKMSDWWPMETHSISAGANTLPANLIVERARDGRIVEVDSDGNTHLWGSFETYQAPSRVIIAWHVGEPASRSTYIEVVFGMETNGTTSVVLTHGGWEALGDDAEQKRADYDSGWDFVFGECYFNACKAAAKAVKKPKAPERPTEESKKKSGKSRFSSLSEALHLVH